MDVSMQNIMTWHRDVSTLILSRLSVTELVMASRVCKALFLEITSREELWEKKIKQIDNCKKYKIIKEDYPTVTSTYYEKWRLFIKNLFEKSAKDSTILSMNMPPQILTDETGPEVQYYLVSSSESFGRPKHHLTISEEERERLREELFEKRREMITKMNNAFHTALSLYLCDVQDKSFVHRYISFIEKQDAFLIVKRFLFASALFLKEGNSDDYFNLKFEHRDYSKAIKALVSISLQQGNCEQALEWIKRYVDSIHKAYKIKEKLMIQFGQQAICEQKSELFEELLSHLLSLDDPDFWDNAAYKQKIIRRVLSVLQELHNKGHAEIVDSLIKKLSL